MSLAVVGAPFANKDGSNRQFEIKLCSPGEAVYLRPEAKNKYDPRAVAVFSVRDVQIGYVRAERAGLVRSWFSNSRDFEAVFQEETPWGAVIRVALDGAPLTIPPPGNWARPNAGSVEEWVDPDPGFWPDDAPPDE